MGVSTLQNGRCSICISESFHYNIFWSDSSMQQHFAILNVIQMIWLGVVGTHYLMQLFCDGSQAKLCDCHPTFLAAMNIERIRVFEVFNKKIMQMSANKGSLIAAYLKRSIRVLPVFLFSAVISGFLRVNIWRLLKTVVIHTFWFQHYPVFSFCSWWSLSGNQRKRNCLVLHPACVVSKKSCFPRITTDLF